MREKQEYPYCKNISIIEVGKIDLVSKSATESLLETTNSVHLQK